MQYTLVFMLSYAATVHAGVPSRKYEQPICNELCNHNYTFFLLFKVHVYKEINVYDY